MPADPRIEAAIRQAAEEAGEDPAFALAVAEQESTFNPRAHSSKTIHGLYQMRGDLRAKYGAGDSDEPLDQARGWMRSLPDLRRDMKSVLGRDPTNEEVYLGHHYGAKRAARSLNLDPSMPTEAIFTPQEMGINPHFARAGTIGNLNGSVMGDIGKRMARFGGAASSPADAEPADLSSFGTSAQQTGLPAAPDLSSFGTMASLEQPPTGADPNMALEERKYSAPESEPQQSAPQPASPAPQAPDLSRYGTLVS